MAGLTITQKPCALSLTDPQLKVFIVLATLIIYILANAQRLLFIIGDCDSANRFSFYHLITQQINDPERLLQNINNGFLWCRARVVESSQSPRLLVSRVTVRIHGLPYCAAVCFNNRKTRNVYYYRTLFHV